MINLKRREGENFKCYSSNWNDTRTETLSHLLRIHLQQQTSQGCAGHLQLKAEVLFFFFFLSCQNPLKTVSFSRQPFQYALKFTERVYFQFVTNTKLSWVKSIRKICRCSRGKIYLKKHSILKNQILSEINHQFNITISKLTLWLLYLNYCMTEYCLHS